MADLGLPDSLMPTRLGIPPRTWKRWISKGKKSDDDSSPEARLWHTIHRGASELAQKYLGSLHGQAAQGNVPAITWLLTHHPVTRDEFSDAAADRRVERRTMASVVDAIASANLPPEQERLLLLNLQARGLGAAPAGPSDADA